MKINEIIVENQLDEVGTIKAIGGALAGLRGGIAGAKGGYAAGKAAGVEQDLINRTVQKAMASWGQQQQRLTTAGQQPKVEDVTAWFTQFAKQPPTANPAGVGPGQVTPWLKKEIAAYLVKKHSAQPAAPDEQPIDQQPKQPQQTAQPKPIEVGAKTNAGTEVVKPEPLTLKYKNQNYIRGGERGEWTRFGSTKPIPPTEQAFLDSEEDELSGVVATPSNQPAQTQAPAAIQQPETPAAPQQLPDVSNLTPEERAQLVQQIKQQLGQQA